MKYIGKFLLSIVTVAIIIFGFFYYRGGKIVSAFEVERMETLIIENYQDIKELRINMDLSEIHVEKSDKDYIEVIYPIFDDKNLEIKVEQDGSVLKVDMIDKGKLLNFSIPSFNTDAIKTTVKIPENYSLNNLGINLAMGDLYTESIKTEQSELNLDMGTLHASQASLGKLQAKLNMGSAEFKDVVVAGDTAINIDMGSFEGNLKIMGGKVDMAVNMGSVDLDLYDGNYKITADADLGDVKNKDGSNQNDPNEIDGEITIQVSMGDIKIKE